MAACVSMHLLVLSAFRPESDNYDEAIVESQCTFWCSVLSDRCPITSASCWSSSQCTFWCSVLSDSGCASHART